MIEELKTKIKLPALKPVIQRTLAIIDNPNATAYLVATEISQDPALTAKILRIVNSPFYGFPQKISSLSHAVVILGMSVLKGILIAIHFSDEKYDLSIMPFILTLWQHQTECSYAAGEIVSLLSQRKKVPKNIFRNATTIVTAALLHDIGKAVIAQNYPQEAITIYKAKNIEFEKENLGFTHEDINFYLCEEWTLPDNLKFPLSFHHYPENAPELFSKEAAIIHLADALLNEKAPKKEAIDILEITEQEMEEIEKRINNLITTNLTRQQKY